MKETKTSNGTQEADFNTFFSEMHYVHSPFERWTLFLLIDIVELAAPTQLDLSYFYSQVLEYITERPYSLRKQLMLLFSLLVQSFIFLITSSPKFVIVLTSVLMLTYSLVFFVLGLSKGQIIITTPVIIMLFGSILGFRIQTKF